jgi:molybdopterin-guanine dinucleotide biosynthesis protein A
MQITGIILAGGKSLRMGTDKTFIKVEGKPLLAHAVELLQPLCQKLLISSNNRELSYSNIKVISDETENCGPLGGIYSCLKQSETEWNFILSVDSPFVHPGFITALKNELNGFDAVVPVHNKGNEPLIAFYNKSCLPAMQKQLEAGNYKMQRLLNGVNIKWVESGKWIAKYPEIFRNLNKPSDLNT